MRTRVCQSSSGMVCLLDKTSAWNGKGESYDGVMTRRMKSRGLENPRLYTNTGKVGSKDDLYE
jgi:hypothetical protein